MWGNGIQSLVFLIKEIKQYVDHDDITHFETIDCESYKFLGEEQSLIP